MSDETCDSCKHWNPPNEHPEGPGLCKKLIVWEGHEIAKGRPKLDESCRAVTPSDFGCVYYTPII